MVLFATNQLRDLTTKKSYPVVEKMGSHMDNCGVIY